MKFKERLKNIKLFFNIEKELQMKLLQLEEINKKKLELQSLKTETIELKDFINSNFKDEFKDYDYKVNIINCYIISINGKKYISVRSKETSKSDCYTLATGHYKYLYEYKCGYFDNRSYYVRKKILMKNLIMRCMF